jgi:hypothetical protein
MEGRSITKCGGLAVILMALTGVTALADMSLQNGDFSLGFTGWTVEYGTVTDGGGYALFQEDPTSLTSTLSQSFTIPALAHELSFNVAMTSTGTYDPGAWPDAFTASLLDRATRNPLLSNPTYTDFYYIDHTGVVETIAGVSGNTVTLDISGLGGHDAYLVFDLLASDDGMATTVNVDNVNVSVVPLPGALLLGLIGIGTVGSCRRFLKAD